MNTFSTDDKKQQLSQTKINVNNDEKSFDNNTVLTHTDLDINRSEGEGLGTTSYHRTVNSQNDNNATFIKGDQPSIDSHKPSEMNSDKEILPKTTWKENFIAKEKELSNKAISIGDKITSKINETDSKYLGISKKFNEIDDKYHITSTLENKALNINDAAVFFGKEISKGNISTAFKYSTTAAMIGECERKKHNKNTSLGGPQWLPEDDKEGLVLGSVGKGPTLNEILQKEAETEIDQNDINSREKQQTGKI